MYASFSSVSPIYVPRKNAKEASVVDDIKVVPIDNLYDLVAHLRGDEIMESHPKINKDSLFEVSECIVDMKHIKGQEHAKRALEIAAAGGHNVIMNGPPGSGKTLLAKAMSSILPKLTMNEALEVTKIFSISGNP